MGHRCNLVIIENRQATIYYDHWAANRLDLELMWGPEIARIFIEEREPAPDFWLDDIWAEGGCVVDFDTKYLLWYGGDEITDAPELNLMAQALMKSQWMGWSIEWAKDGIFDIARRAGVSIDLVSADKPSEPEDLVLSYICESGPYKFLHANNVISIVDQGKLSWAILYGSIESLANVDLDPFAVARLVRNFSEDHLEQCKLLDPVLEEYAWGAHFDLDRRSLEYWNPKPSEGLQTLVKQKLRNWSVVDHGPDYLWHKALVPAKDWPTISRQKKLDLIQVYRQLLSEEHTNPMENVLTAISNDCKKNIQLQVPLEKRTNPMADIQTATPNDCKEDIQVNPDTLEHRTGDQELLPIKNTILDNLEAELKKQK